MKTRQMARRLLLLPALAALLGAACGEDGAAVLNGDAVAGDDAGTQEIHVLMYDHYFEPAEIAVRAGAPVTFIVENVGIAIHNLVIRGEAADG